MSVDIVTPFDFDNPSALPPGARKFDLILNTAPRQPSLFKRSRAQSTSAERPTPRVSPVDEGTYDELLHSASVSISPVMTPTPSTLALSRSNSFGSWSAGSSRTSSAGGASLESSSGAVAVTSDHVQLNTRQSPGKPKKIKIIDWRQRHRSFDVDDVCEWPSVDSELRKSGGEPAHASMASKRKEPSIDEEEPSITSYETERWAHNRRMMRAAATYNDDTADPLAVYGSVESAELEDVASIINRMEEF